MRSAGYPPFAAKETRAVVVRPKAGPDEERKAKKHCQEEVSVVVGRGSENTLSMHRAVLYAEIHGLGRRLKSSTICPWRSMDAPSAPNSMSCGSETSTFATGLLGCNYTPAQRLYTRSCTLFRGEHDYMVYVVGRHRVSERRIENKQSVHDEKLISALPETDISTLNRLGLNILSWSRATPAGRRKVVLPARFSAGHFSPHLRRDEI